MQVPAGRTDAGMVHHKIHDENWTGLPTIPAQDSQRRLLSPVSTAATLNMAAVAAQASRLWKTLDPTFSAKALAAAQTAYAAAKANPNRIASANDGTGGGAYGDTSVTDEFYWAAAELYATTGSEHVPRRRHRLVAVPRRQLRAARVRLGLDRRPRRHDARAGPDRRCPSSDVAATRAAIVTFADAALARATNQAYPAPNNAGSVYYWGSNGQVANNANALALALRLHRAGEVPHRRVRARSTTSRAATRSTSPTSRATARRRSRTCTTGSGPSQADASLPIAPPGSFSGGPNSELQDPIAAAQLAGCAPQKCFVDHIEAYSVNEVAINWNSALAWLASWAAEHAGSTPAVDTTPPSTPGTPTASAVGDTSVTLTWTASTDARERDRAVRRRARRRGLARDRRDDDHDLRHGHGPARRHVLRVRRQGAQRRPAERDVPVGAA